MLDTLRPAERYSYLFDGSAQTLDHILLNAPAMQIFTRGAYARVNADFPESLRADASRPERLSDHDPAVAYLRITADVTGELRVVNQGALYLRGSRLWSGAVTITNPGTAAVSGPLQLVLQNLPAGVTVANADGTWNGQPYLTIPGELAPGASATVNVLFQNPSFAAIQFTARVFSGPLQ
jgi:hypothetical protein